MEEQPKKRPDQHAEESDIKGERMGEPDGDHPRKTRE